MGEHRIQPLLMPGRDAEQILRVVREALLNARKHSQANHVVVSLEGQANQHSIRIEDNGIGFDMSKYRTKNGNHHFGLRIMQARAARIGGEYAGMHLLGVGEGRDVAYAVAFLLGDTGRWITGTTLVVDGGYIAH